MQTQLNGYVNGAAQPIPVAAQVIGEQTKEKVASGLTGDEISRRLEEPFDGDSVKWVVKSTAKQNSQQGMVDRGFVLPYVDCRQYADRLNEVIGLGRWTRKYNVQVVPGIERKFKSGNEWKTAATAKIVVTCELLVGGLGTQTGLGEEWADDDNAATAAEAQAFKRACSMFGVGRYLYDLGGQWVDIDQHKRPVHELALPDWAKPATQRTQQTTSKPASRGLWNGNNLHRQELVAELERLCGAAGSGLAASILRNSLNVTSPEKLRDLTKVPQTIERLQNAIRGIERLRAAIESAGSDAYEAACQKCGIAAELDAIPDTAVLRQLIETIEAPVSAPLTIQQLRGHLLCEARRVVAGTDRSLADLIAKSSGGKLSLESLFKTGEKDRAAFDAAIRDLREVKV